MSFEKELQELLLDESFQRWISGQASEKEKQMWESWLSASPQRAELVKEARILWRSLQFQSSTPPNVDAAWHRLHQAIQQKKKPKQHIEHRAVWQLHRPSTKRPYRYLVAAAIFFLILAASIFVVLKMTATMRSKYLVVTTDYGERKTLHLADGSEIILNANSRLQMPRNWDATKGPQIFLHGEAYFHIRPVKYSGKHNVFVETVDGRVEVVGTIFSVLERGKGTRVTLEKGKVRVGIKAKKNSSHLQNKVILQQGESVFFQAGGSPVVESSADVDFYVKWWRNTLVLKHTPVKAIIERIQDTFGVKIVVNDKSILNRRLSGTIENTNLETLLQSLSIALQVPVARKNSFITLGG